MPRDTLHNPSPFHAGEKAVQERLGVSDIEDWARKVVRDHLPDEHRAFHTALPYLVVAARDEAGRPWVSLLCGRNGFITSPDPGALVIDAAPGLGDALAHAFVPGADIGILGIELSSRRRNRLNGRIREGGGDSGGAIICGVDQTFGNCPQYIRERAWRQIDDNRIGGYLLPCLRTPWGGRKRHLRHGRIAPGRPAGLRPGGE